LLILLIVVAPSIHEKTCPLDSMTVIIVIALGGGFRNPSEAVVFPQ
jgi:hypothetical protein